MGHLVLSRFMAMHRERCRRRRRRRQAPGRDGSVASLEKAKGSACQLHDDPHSRKRKRCSGPDLPEEILQHIHSLMPFRDAGRAACVSRAFLCSWRRRADLTFNTVTLWSTKGPKDFTEKVDHIMKKHSGIGMKALTIDFDGLYYSKACNYLNDWLQIAVTSGIQELVLDMYSFKRKAHYNFPCSVLSDGNASSIRVLRLCRLTFRPADEPGCFASLTTLHLNYVRVTGYELGSLLSNSLALVHLKLRCCHEIESLKIPCVLQQLSYLDVDGCRRLQAIESKAPNLLSLRFFGKQLQHVNLSFEESLLMKDVSMLCADALFHACEKLPSFFPNLETLVAGALGWVVNTPMVPSKFLHLKDLHLSLSVAAPFPSFDYFSLVPVLDASPSLETFTLDVAPNKTEHDSILGDPSHLRQMAGHRHDNLQCVNINGFRSAKSLVELVCHILEKTSIECLTLDTTGVFSTCSTSSNSRCSPISKDVLKEAHKALSVIRTYIEGKVPSTVELDVLEPCSRCHSIEIEPY